MAKSTKKTQESEDKMVEDKPYTFSKLPFHSLKDVYERLMLESFESWSINLAKTLLNYQPHRNHIPLRKINLDLVEVINNKPRFTKSALDQFGEMDRLLKQILNPRADYAQLLTHLYYGLSYFSVGAYEQKPSLEGKKFLKLCNELKDTIKKQEVILERVWQESAYLTLRTQGAFLQSSDLMKPFTEFQSQSFLFDRIVNSECAPNTGKDINREYGIRLIFDSINSFKNERISIAKELNNFSLNDEGDLKKAIDKCNKEAHKRGKLHYLGYAKILTSLGIVLLYGELSHNHKDVGAIIDNRRKKKVEKGLGTPFKGATDSVLLVMDNSIREGMYSDYKKRLKDNAFSNSQKESFRKNLKEFNQAIAAILISYPDDEINEIVIKIKKQK